MSFANFGIGIAGLAQGLSQGVDIGTKINKVRDDNKLRQIREEGLNSAKEARQGAIDSLVQQGNGPQYEGGKMIAENVPTYKVDGQSYGDQASARKAAEGKVGSLDEFYTKVAAPKIYEQYLAIDPEKAEAWKTWNDAKEVKAGQKLWVQAVMKANMGDFDGFGQSLVKAYNTRGYFDDGTKVKDWKTLKDDKGNITGAQLTFKGPDGKEYSQNINGMEDAYRVGAFMLSPENVFNTGYGEIMANRKAQLEIGKEDRKFQRDVYRDDRKADNARELQTQRDDAATGRTVTGKQMDAANKKAEIELRNAAGQLFKRGASPEEAKRMLVTGMASKYVDYDGKPTMTAEEIGAIADQYIREIYKGGGQNPMAGGIPGQGAAPAGRTPIIIDTTNGQLSPYQR